MLNNRFPKVVDALAALNGDFVLDGELVALDSQGRPSFQLLRNTLLQSLPTYCYAFDLLNRDGGLLVNLPFSRPARAAGETCIPRAADLLRLSPLLRAPSEDVLEAVLNIGLEGVVGKRIDSSCEPGERSGAWIKLRANMEQEFVVGGYIPGARGFDAIAYGCLREKGTHFRGEGEERVCHDRLRENLGTDSGWIYDRLMDYLTHPTDGRLRFAHYALERALANKGIKPHEQR